MSAKKSKAKKGTASKEPFRTDVLFALVAISKETKLPNSIRKKAAQKLSSLIDTI